MGQDPGLYAITEGCMEHFRGGRRAARLTGPDGAEEQESQNQRDQKKRCNDDRSFFHRSSLSSSRYAG